MRNMLTDLAAQYRVTPSTLVRMLILQDAEKKFGQAKMRATYSP
jgi:hypothetical protein